jgi:hypothetical protein
MGLVSRYNREEETRTEKEDGEAYRLSRLVREDDGRRSFRMIGELARHCLLVARFVKLN